MKGKNTSKTEKKRWIKPTLICLGIKNTSGGPEGSDDGLGGWGS